MENLRKVLLKIRSDFDGECEWLPYETQVRHAVSILGQCEVFTKKISITKKPPSANDTHSNLTKYGLYGYPKVFVRAGSTTIRMTHEHMATPFFVRMEAKWCYNEIRGRWRYLHKVDFSRFAIPQIMTKPPFSLAYHDKHTEDLGRWLSRLPALTDLDMKVRQAWRQQEDSFDDGVRKYVARNSKKIRKNFQEKLARHLADSHLGNLSASDVRALFEMSLHHNSDLKNFMQFCANNQLDRHFIEESDFSSALDMSKVDRIMGE